MFPEEELIPESDNEAVEDDKEVSSEGKAASKKRKRHLSRHEQKERKKAKLGAAPRTAYVSESYAPLNSSILLIL